MKVFLFPGASLMQLSPIDDDHIRVRCPGCGVEQIFSTADADAAFGHEDGCLIFAKIERAMKLYEKAAVNRG
jgi:hypothetical protein